MFCKYCGSEIKDDALFCPSCGKSVAEDNQTNNYQTQGGQNAYQSGQQPYYQNQNGQQNYYQNQYQQNQYQAPGFNQNSTGLNILGFLIPLVGLILFCVYQGTEPVKAHNIGKWALIGFIVGIVCSIVVYGCAAASIVSYY